ncbi:MAG: hypothetical protein HY719_16990 [Planctomycetes bacterium]|nr:hypothetical protein [Planctomycetota bacterium]
MAEGNNPTETPAAKGGEARAKDTRWAEVVELRFEGERFQDHALDFDVLPELIQFKKMIVETAKALWKRANPDRKNLPAGFEERIRLRFVTLKEGSTGVPVQALVRDAPNGDLFDKGTTEEEAIELAYEVFAANEKGEALPNRLPKEVLAEYTKCGETLREGESIGIHPHHRPGTTPREPAAAPRFPRAVARVTSATRERLATYREAPHESTIEVQGEIEEANVRQRRFEIRVKEKTTVLADFDPEQEDKVTTALKEHRTVRVRVRGTGERSPDGAPLRIKKIDLLEFVSPEGPKYDDTAPPIEDVLAAFSAKVPMEEWEKVPSDGSEHLDKYIYGPPKE